MIAVGIHRPDMRRRRRNGEEVVHLRGKDLKVIDKGKQIRPIQGSALWENMKLPVGPAAILPTVSFIKTAWESISVRRQRRLW